MGNVPPTPFPIFNAKAHADATNEWVQSAFPPGITDFLTVSLTNPNSVIDPSIWNSETSSLRQDLLRDIIRRIDKHLYGRSHLKKEQFLKFEFLILEETRDARGNVVFAHVHAGLALLEAEREKFLDCWPKIQRDIENLVKHRKLQPDVWVQDADNGVSGYIAKNASTEVETILTRDTMYE